MKASEILETLVWLDNNVSEGQANYFLDQMANALKRRGISVLDLSELAIINSFITVTENERKQTSMVQ
jgi:hypothetical protein